ncbi:MAG: gamma-glutamylcyclotransferase [Pseudomonadota bacterium]
MPLPEAVFRHAPELEGLIRDPETSFFRDMATRIEEFDANALAEGRDLSWRISHEEREATRRALLAGREGEPVWIFAYGSLIWDPAIRIDEIRRGRLEGWRRSFCLHLEGGRGTPEAPGLMAALDADPGHACEGLAMRVPGDIAEEETRILWMREMIAGTYEPAFVPVDTPEGEVEAIAFLADPTHDRYVNMPRRERATRIATASGNLGTNLEYLENLLASLEHLGIHDAEMHELHEMCLGAKREAEGG